MGLFGQTLGFGRHDEEENKKENDVLESRRWVALFPGITRLIILATPESALAIEIE